MHIEFTSLAQTEVQSVTNWYREKAQDVADGFLNELEFALDAILADSESWPRLNQFQRYISLRRFPYVIVFEVMHERIWIVAVAHSSRKPDYWLRR